MYNLRGAVGRFRSRSAEPVSELDRWWWCLEEVAAVETTETA